MFMHEDDKLLDVARRESNYLYDQGLIDASIALDELIKQRAELLEALKMSKKLRDIEREMGAIERTRAKGNYGIAVDSDECAKDWQSKRIERDDLLLVVDKTITKAEATE